MNQVDLLVFDVGGVFRNSSKALAEGAKRALESAGVSFPFNVLEVWRLRGIGKYNNSRNWLKALTALSRTKERLGEIMAQLNAEAAVDKIVEKNITPLDEEKLDGMNEVYKQFFKSREAGKLVALDPNAAGAMKKLKAKGYQLAILTNSSGVTVQRDLAGVDLSDFNLIFSEESVKKKKPSGEGITAIIKKLGARPEQTAYVGDTVVDIWAARDAGCKAIAVLCGMGQKSHLEKEKPDYLFKDLKELSEAL